MKKLVLVIFFCLLNITNVYGSNLMNIDDFDLDSSKKILEKNNIEVDVDTLINKIMKGQIIDILDDGIDLIKENIRNEYINVKNIVLKLILTIIFTALVSNVFFISEKNGTNNISFYICYSLMISVLINIFAIVIECAEGLIISIVELMSALLPAYLLSVGILGQVSAMGYNGIFMIIITCIQILILKIVFSLIKIYMIVSLINNISKEDLLSKTSEGIKRLITYIYKLILVTVSGLNILESLVLPIVDNSKNNIIKKAVSSLPLVGGGVGTTVEILYNSANLIKNSIGVLGILLILFLCIVPYIKVQLTSLFVQGISAIFQPVTDKRVVQSMSYTFESIKLVQQGMTLSIFLFIINIAIICIATK